MSTHADVDANLDVVVDIGADVKNVFLRSPDRKIGPPPHTHNIMGDAQKKFFFQKEVIKHLTINGISFTHIYLLSL